MHELNWIVHACCHSPTTLHCEKQQFRISHLFFWLAPIHNHSFGKVVLWSTIYGRKCPPPPQHKKRVTFDRYMYGVPFCHLTLAGIYQRNKFICDPQARGWGRGYKRGRKGVDDRTTPFLKTFLPHKTFNVMHG